MREGRADIGITYLPTTNEFQAWELLRDEYFVLLPPTATVRNPQLTWGELADYPLVLLLPCARMLPAHLKKLQEDSTIVSMVVQELGTAILPRLGKLGFSLILSRW